MPKRYDEWRVEFFSQIERDGHVYDLWMSTPVSHGFNLAVYVCRRGRIGTPRPSQPVIVCVVDRSNRSHEEKCDPEYAAKLILFSKASWEWGMIDEQKKFFEDFGSNPDNIEAVLKSGAEPMGRIKDATSALSAMFDVVERLWDLRLDFGKGG